MFILFHLILSISFCLSFIPDSKWRFAQTSLYMKHYEYAKEYFEFYKKYKNPILQQSQYVNYQEFVNKNNHSYSLFEKNFKKIQEANEYLSIHNHTLTLDLNQYAYIIDFEGNMTYDLMVNPIIPPTVSPKTYFKVLKSPISYLEELQPNDIGFHWNHSGLLSEVKNQGSCGSCWAFSTTGALETFMRIRNFSVQRLAEQELVDCSKENHGCNGGLMHLAFDYIKNNNGLYHDKDYPYQAIDQNCTHLNVSKAKGSHIQKYAYTIPSSILDLKVCVRKNPISIALDANNLFFRFYKNGVIDVPRNISKELNHAVLLVGYDYDEKGMYWIIQNSWGKEWGEDGFCKLRVHPDEGTLMCQVYGVYPRE